MAKKHGNPDAVSDRAERLGLPPGFGSPSFSSGPPGFGLQQSRASMSVTSWAAWCQQPPGFPDKPEQLPF
jgi:hypothetical protein